MSTMVKRGTKQKFLVQRTTLLSFKETKELILTNHIKPTAEQKRKKSEKGSYLPLTAF